MPETLDTLTVDFNARTDKLSMGLNKLKPQFASVGASASAAGGMILTKFINPVTAGLAALTGIGSTIGGLSFGVKLAAQAETAQTAFRTMIGDVERADALFKEIDQFSARTPFERGELRDAGRQLLAFGFAAEDVMSNMQNLGDLAAGTGKPIADFVDILGKVKAGGLAQLGDVMRLADRGVPIFQALADTMGVSQDAVRKLASEGKIGFTELQSALRSVTAEGGLFAGGMESQSKTLAGLWSTLKDNFNGAFEEIGKTAISAFDLKGIVGNVTQFIQSGTAMFLEWVPTIQAVSAQAFSFLDTLGQKFMGFVQFVGPPLMQWFNATQAQFSMLWEIGSMAADGIMGAMSSMFELLSGTGLPTINDLRTAYTVALVAMEYAFTNWQTVGKLALYTIAYESVKFQNQIVYLFETVIPETMAFAANNWQDILKTMGDYALTAFINIGENVQKFMGAVADAFSGKGFNFEFTALTEGARNYVDETLKLTDRVPDAMEDQLRRIVDIGQAQVARGFNELLDKRMAEFKQVEDRLSGPLFGSSDAAQPGTTAGGSGTTGSTGTGFASQASGLAEKAVAAVTRGSQEAFSAIRAFEDDRRTADEQRRQTQLQAEIAAGIKKIAENTKKEQGARTDAPKPLALGGGFF